MISANFKMCLTGTPLENHLGEFYSLLDLAVSGSLGEHATFREKFVTPDTIDPIELRYLKLKAKPLVLRRTKSEILTELPPKLESTIRLPFEQKQEKIYRDIALSWNEKVKGSILDQGESKSQLLMLTALLRLRQACSDPASIPNVKYTEEPPKVTVLLEALQEITESGESALVFTQFLHTFGRIKKELAAHNIESFSLHGGTSRPERERILREFQNSTKGSVLLMTLKTGGVGLNLVKASYVFHLEPWWNPAVENQASDRAHRLGQQKPVQVYRYLMKESVEEKIEILKERKSARFNSLFSSTDTESEAELSTGNSQLSQADFEYLLS
jgi:SNF2 family DNA or RNA helicase